ncbi:ATPase assembly factor ATP10 [Scheffersomyces coipomensis]|uniref:ATPase assembly factor ATP10 n=1 Tax=Scheffersomyces coipomensis TaxID=1788519 RepID=UPI00315DC1E9
MMNKNIIRTLSCGRTLLNEKKPAFNLPFVKTISEATKSPIRESIPIKRPIGLPEPTIINKHAGSLSMGNLFKEIFSSEGRDKRRESLNYDLKHSILYESKSFLNTKGKIFTPPISYFKKEKSRYFANFKGHRLIEPDINFYDLLKGKVNVVRVYSKQSAFDCVKSYFEIDGKDLAGKDYNEFLTKFNRSQIIDINLPYRWYEGYFLNQSKKSILKRLPKERYGNYFILPLQELPYKVREELMCDNMCAGYIYVIDEDGKIRWCTSGKANDEELEFLWMCLERLEKELDIEEVDQVKTDKVE